MNNSSGFSRMSRVDVAQSTSYKVQLPLTGLSLEEARDVIKSHHNVGGLPDDVDLIIVEPLREFYKR